MTAIEFGRAFSWFVLSMIGLALLVGAYLLITDLSTGRWRHWGKLRGSHSNQLAPREPL
jgi:hypothetical protein